MNFLKKIFSSRGKDCGNLSYYKSLIGFTPRHVEYYEAAFTHKSVNKEDGEGHKVNYERLEFLGDAVLGVVIADYLFTHVPQGNEGYLTQMRAKIVSREQLNMIGKNLHFEKVIKSSFLPSSIPLDVYGNTMEALIGAIYKDRGYEKCRKFIYRVIIEPYVNISALEHKVSSYKSLMIQLAQKSPPCNLQALPLFSLCSPGFRSVTLPLLSGHQATLSTRKTFPCETNYRHFLQKMKSPPEQPDRQSR